jgi:hypothetical protein
VNYNTSAGTSVLVGVNGTPASVTAAITSITSGTLGGLVPGVALINAIATANAAVDTYAKAAAVTNPTFDTTKDGKVDSTEANAALLTANTARTAAGAATSTVTNSLADANTALVAAKAAAVAAGNTGLVSTYDSAIAAQKALVGTATPAAALTAAQTAETSALAGADVALTANGLLLPVSAANVTYLTLAAKFDTAAGNAAGTTVFTKTSLQTALDATPATATDIAAKAALTTELAKLPTYGQQSIDAATKVAALNTAATNVTNATVAGISDYTTKAATAASAADLLVKVTAADAAVTAAKLVVDKYTSLGTDITTAQGALNTFKVANADKVSITDVAATVAGSAVQATAKSDVFYFASKALAANDFAIGGTTNFGAGDSIVLGSAYTYNAGALSTGNSNALEVFLVKGATGTQVVIENDAYGNSTTTVDAAGNVTASPNATVINLVGVTADHLSVANGVVSYV